MRKPAFCICENKDADQLRGNREADHVEQSSFIQIVDMNRFFTGTCERLVNRLSEKVVKSRILPKIQVCSENKNKHKI